MRPQATNPKMAILLTDASVWRSSKQAFRKNHDSLAEAMGAILGLKYQRHRLRFSIYDRPRPQNDILLSHLKLPSQTFNLSSIPLHTKMSARPSKADLVASKKTIHKFKVAKKTITTNSARKRAGFDPLRRQQVKLVREKRACLRCSLL